jgi:uncharacterized RDD family membrane protein YckC
MKCPKCQYISFDSGDRCRNCGYDFSLALDLPAPDLPIQDGSEPIGPFSDFTLNEKPPDTGSLPLFKRGTADPDAPLVTPSLTPRAPLAVRRGAPVPARPRPRRTEPNPEPRLALDTAEMPVAPEPQRVREAISISLPHSNNAPRPEGTSVAPASESGSRITASAGARIIGGLIDATILFGVDLTVVYFTLKICDMTFLEAPSLPMAPLLSFLALLNGGYLATFVAAGGQTIGKMAAGTRVVPADPAAPLSERVSFGQAAVRAVAYLVSLLPLGLGFLPGLIGRERRALHDRLADTRVVRA